MCSLGSTYFRASEGWPPLDSSGYDPSLVRNASHPLHSIITTFWLRARALHTWPLSERPGYLQPRERGDGGGPEARPRHTCPGRGAHPFTHMLIHDMANVY